MAPPVRQAQTIPLPWQVSFYGGGTAVLKAQLIGSLTITIATFAVAFVLMWVIKQLPHPWRLRVEEGETVGLDVFEHGSGAYPNQDGAGLAVIEANGKTKGLHSKLLQD